MWINTDAWTRLRQVNRLAGIATCVHCLLPPTWVPIQMSPPAMSPTAAAARGGPQLARRQCHVIKSTPADMLSISSPPVQSSSMQLSPSLRCVPAEEDERHNLLADDARRGGSQALAQH